ncbi:hypothetical protein KSS87_014246 [Heliosperma pusillum]|nr:hypothetical protein KSS87_014166 [Heliosperma pusillum]KAH9624681.1 hypothetical protein KSS87_014246 [Heliosperma pusillum]
MEVKIISNDTVKPSCPTPPERKTITLSFLDESFMSVHVPYLLIYTNNNESTKTTINSPIITSLKTSLSETLTHFYPLAGRFENEYTVSCNDEGIPFVVAGVECQLKDYLNSPHKLELVSKLLPPSDILSLGQLPITTVVSLAFQVNIFACGGVAIGCYSNHKLLDATSMSNFLNYWAAQTSGRYEDLVEPDFDTIVRVFPPLPKQKRVDDATATEPAELWNHVNVPIKVVVKSFKFDNEAINKLKANAVTETVPKPSSFEAVAAFVWMHAVGAILQNNKQDIAPPQPIPTVIFFSASLRPRATPPLPRQTMGNLVTNVKAQVGDGNESENGGEAFLAEIKDVFKDLLDDKSSIFSVTSWCKLGLNEVDFGFGRPDKTIPVGVIYPFLQNRMILVDYTDSHGNGIEVYVYLEDKYMPFLERNSQFKYFATSS